MTKGLTTIAPLPSAGGCMSSLPAEVGKAPDTVAMRATYLEEALEFPEIDHAAIPAPADKHGFEPFDYTERS